jgi:hydroxypyruvate reductase
MRRDAIRIFKAGLRAADPVEAINRNVSVDGRVLKAGGRKYRLDAFDHLYVIGAGKAGAAMALAVERLLGRRITAGWVNVKDGHTAKLRRIHLHECGHPVPDERGVRGAEEIAGLAAGAGQRDLVMCLVSGGASALTPFPARPLTLANKQATTRLLLDCGADIHEINTVRKHLSSIKGGRLAALAYPATVLTLILSDVIGDDLDVIGSGLTAPDASTFAEAQAVLRKYDIERRVPESVREHLTQGAAGGIPETPKADAPAFARTRNLIVGSNRLAVAAAATEAKALGYRTLVLSSMIDGETRDVARVHAAIAKEIRATGQPLRAPACIISGGETTVTIRGSGKGGRNQEFVLAAAIALSGMDRVCVLSAGTDGTDGPTDAAGAVAGGRSLAGLDAASFLASNDSYNFFTRVGGLLKTGPTNTNVMDVRVILVG